MEGVIFLLFDLLGNFHLGLVKGHPFGILEYLRLQIFLWRRILVEGKSGVLR
jgi:hypothetical protein